MFARAVHLIAFVLPLAAAGCAETPAQQADARAYDGRYLGPFVLNRAVSAFSCPYADGGTTVMVIQGGHARVDVSQGAYFDGQVSPDGALTLSSGQGRAAFISGRITGGRYVASGTGLCQYSVGLTRGGAGSAGS